MRGEQRRAHNESEAERLLGVAVAALKMTEDEFLKLKFNRPEKQAVAWLLKSQTTVEGVWLAQRLQMGSRANVSRALAAMSSGRDAKKNSLKKKMTQCAG